LRHVVSLSSFAEHVQGPAPGVVAWFRLTPASIARAISRGEKAEALVAELRDALGGHLPAVWPRVLRRWARAGQAFRIRRITVVETASREMLRELLSWPGARDCLGRPLSSRIVTIDEGKLPRLLGHLRRHGYWPRVDLPGEGEGGDAGKELKGLAGLWLAGEVYAELKRFIRLPVPPPHGVLHGLEKELSPAAHSAAESALSETLERLAQVVNGWAAYPAVETKADVEEWVTTIERALQEGRDLELVYWTAGRNERTRRRVTPYWLERRREVPYLVGYCHHRQAERVFRVDRIERLRLVE